MEKTDWKKELIDWIKSFVFCFVFVWLLVTFITQTVQVSGPSMYPTLQDGQLAFTSKISYRLHGVSRYDVVVAYLEAKDEKIVKRVIGLPNETIFCKDGVIYVNDEPLDQDFLDETYVAEETAKYGVFTEAFGPVTLQEDEYFLLGDNRRHSSDSRYFGVFTEDELESVHLWVWFPFSEMKVVK